MRGLSGDFSTMPVKDLVVHLGNRRVTGALGLECGDVHKQLLVRGGHVVSASSDLPREFLGQFLINMGHLSEEQFEKAYATQKETNILLGKILVMTGLVSEATVQSTLSLKFRETLLDAFQWEDGEFTFHAADELPVPEGLDVQVDLLDIHREGEFRETAWQAMRGVFPSGRVRLGVDPGKLPEPPQPGSLDARLVAAIQDGQTIDELALTLHATDFFLYQRLYALYRRDVVRVVDEAPPSYQPRVAARARQSVIGSESPAAEVILAARTFLENGSYKDGEALARRAYELEPTADTADLLREAQAELLRWLRDSLMEPPQVPALQVPPTQIKAMPLSAPERYLLSRVDGRRDVAAIVHVSPLQELEALKFFSGFVEQGLVKLTAR
ncbi:DUF4388 domain-containing protein [Myxococcaceae bacterium GXIMD 01537]